MYKKLLGVFLIVGLMIFSLGACSSKSEVKGTSNSKDKQVVNSEEKKDAKETTEESESSEVIEPTDLLSKAEAEKLLGISLKEPEITENKAVGTKIAFYAAADKDSFDYIQVGIAQKSFMAKKTLEGGQSPKSIYEGIKKAFPDGAVVEGIGDDAFSVPSGLYVLKGEYYITITIQKSDKKTREALEKEAGNIVVGKLK